MFCIVFPSEKEAVWYGLGDNRTNGLRNRSGDLKKMVPIEPDTPIEVEVDDLVDLLASEIEEGEQTHGGESKTRENAENMDVYKHREYFGTTHRTVEDQELVSTEDKGYFEGCRIVVFLDGVEQTITKKQLRDLAAQGIIEPDTLVYLNDEPVPAEKIGGITFKQQLIKEQKRQFEENRYNFKRIAAAQKLVVMVAAPLILVNIILNIIFIRTAGQIPGGILIVMGLCALGISIFAIYSIDNLARSCRVGLFTRLLFMILLMIGMSMSCVSIIILLFTNWMAIDILREEGFDVGFLGVDLEPFEKLLEEQEEVDSRPFYAKMRFVLPLLLLILLFAAIAFVATVVFFGAKVLC